jgi:uncharacterized protein DUF3631
MSARWAADNIDELREADPEIPASMFNRQADNWEPLLAIADRAGGEWPARARAIAAGIADTEDDSSVELLTDIRDVFGAKTEIKSADLTNALVAMEGHSWAEYGRSGKPLSANTLARRLGRFKIKTTDIRFDDGVFKGYGAKQFEDAFARYCAPKPPSGAPNPQHPRQPAETQGFWAETQPQQDDGCCGLESSLTPCEITDVAAVAVVEPQEPQERESTSSRRVKL